MGTHGLATIIILIISYDAKIQYGVVALHDISKIRWKGRVRKRVAGAKGGRGWMNERRDEGGNERAKMEEARDKKRERGNKNVGVANRRAEEYTLDVVRR